MKVRLTFIFGFVLFSLMGMQGLLGAEALKVHGIFRSNMVLQRDKPITIWGWAPVGDEVKVSLGKLSANGKAQGERGGGKSPSIPSLPIPRGRNWW